MLILAIESATPVAGVALMDDGHLLYEQYIDYKKTHSETLMVMIDASLRSCGRRAQDLGLVAVSSGPGSFTGLRIGMAAAKGLAMATGASIIGVPTLQALAMNAATAGSLLCPLLDARKGEVYAGLWEIHDGEVITVAEERALNTANAGAWIAGSMSLLGYRQICCLGSGFEHCREDLHLRLGSMLSSAPAHLSHPRASSVAMLAARRLAAGPPDDVMGLEPLYIRKSEAEYKLEQKAKDQC